MTDSREATSYVRAVIDGIFGDSSLRTLLAAFVVVFAVTEVYHQALPLLFESFGIPLAVLGVSLSLSNVVQVVASPLSGAVADEGGRLTVAGVAAASLGVVVVGFLFASTAPFLAALVVCFAVGSTVLNNSLTPAVNEALQDGIEGIGWGVRDVFMYVGSAAGLAVASYVIARTNRVELVVASLSPPLILLAVYVLHSEVGLSWTALRNRISPGEVDRTSIRDRFARVSDRRLLAMFCVVEVFTTLGMGMSMFLLPALATDLGFDASVYLLVYSGSRLVGAPASVVGGVLTDYVPKKFMYVGNFAVEAVMLLVFGLATSELLFVVGMGLFVFQTTFEPGVMAYFFENFDDDEGGTIWGIKGSVHKAVAVVAPTLGGFAYGVDPNLAFLLGGVLVLVGTLVSLTLPRQY